MMGKVPLEKHGKVGNRDENCDDRIWIDHA